MGTRLQKNEVKGDEERAFELVERTTDLKVKINRTKVRTMGKFQGMLQNNFDYDFS